MWLRIHKVIGALPCVAFLSALHLFSAECSAEDNKPTSTSEQSATESSSSNQVGLNKSILVVPVSKVPLVKSQILPFLKVLVTAKILAGYANQISWGRVTDKDLQKKLWLLFTKTQKINYEIIGLVMQRPRIKNTNLVLPFRFKSIKFEQQYSEDTILKRLKLDKAL